VAMVAATVVALAGVVRQEEPVWEALAELVVAASVATKEATTDTATMVEGLRVVEGMEED